MKERQQMFMSIVEKAATDADFRDGLLADPKATISREFDVTIPDGLRIVVHENDADTVHLPLPAKPQILKEGQLDQVSGGGGECIC
ncbi:MAG: NHLP leader peptide family RiPP precursor [Gammaproteobacteria bacterium]|nr:NHLP leader peptide family RiPP precursor [Gammaproteobacteria bacterium]